MVEREACHEICFRGVPNDWDNALPVGNGRLGAMIFRQGNMVHIAMNHYDCYYRVLPGFRKGPGQSGQTFQDPARLTETYAELCRRADAARECGDGGRSHYARTLHPGQGRGRPSYRGACYPLGGEVLLEISESVDLGDSCLKLRIEEAVVILEAGRGEARVEARIWAARDRDGIVACLSQTHDGLWKNITLTIPPAVGMPPGKVDYAGTGQGLRMRTVYERTEKGGEALSQELALNVPGQNRTGAAVSACSDGIWPLTGAGTYVTAVMSLQPEFGKAEREAEKLAEEVQVAQRRHQLYWEQFWVSGVHLPDAFLERLWYLQLYLMECSCGRGSAWPEQACGLSGLWDIRRPNMWGSMWYWDVNIQSAFWGWGCGGHPEFLKLFCDGYLAYEQEIRAYTQRVYGVEGWALDYPHTLYHCIQPWCAQFLWQYYQYSGDGDFLREKAYPVFLEQITFFRWLSEADKQGIRHIRYDISPEQGPVTEDSVITISCIRRLLRMAVEAGAVLERPEEELEAFRELERELPPYPLTADGNRYKDSLLVQDSVFLRHPSMLMPLFPAEEKGVEENRKLWEHTLQYAAGHTETGTFGMGWLAAAAARLGRGRTALRLLYEKGLDYVLHNNGLAYEESERFLNYCHLTKPSHFLPVMMEAAGGLVNALNLMLLQTGPDGELLLFSAVPDEKPDILESRLQYKEDVDAVEGTYGDWRNVSFRGLLAPGGFQVSAERKGGRVVFLKVESRREGLLKLFLPRELAGDGPCGLVEYWMKPGEVRCWGQPSSESGVHSVSCPIEVKSSGQAGADSDSIGMGGKDPRWVEEGEVLCHLAAGSRRRIFLGANRHTEYYKVIDTFTCAYLLGNELRYPRTPYVFDFGAGMEEKDYGDSYPVQFAVSGQCALYAAGPKRTGICGYSQESGFGFLGTEGIRAVDRGEPDTLRRDFLEGGAEVFFVLYLPRGRYDVLLICGDEQDVSCTRAALPGHGTAERTGKLEAGRYGCLVLPVMHRKDGELRISIGTQEGYRWKLNAMFVNQEYGLSE